MTEQLQSILMTQRTNAKRSKMQEGELTTADEVTAGQKKPLCSTFDLSETSIADWHERRRRHGKR